jgi:hypothetical protein
MNVEVGLPAIMESGDVVGISRGRVSFHEEEADHGSFSIHYIISYTESPAPVSGALSLRLPEELIAAERSYVQQDMQKLEFVEVAEPPEIGLGALTRSKVVLISNFADADSPSAGEIVEARNGKQSLLELYVGKDKRMVEADLNNDGLIDAIYIRKLDSVGPWLHFAPKDELSFMSIDLIAASVEDFADIAFSMAVVEE